jgi:hypothetical protein
MAPSVMGPLRFRTRANTPDSIYVLMAANIPSICGKCVGKAGSDELGFLYLVHLLASWVRRPAFRTERIDKTLYGLGELYK